jgi:hypothetical protein
LAEPRTWSLKEEEFRAVSALPAGERYNHFVKRVADWESVWLLGDDDGPVALADDEGRDYLAVWPHPRYAEACACDAWSGLGPRPIEVHEWVTEWLPRLAEEGSMTVVFPTPSHQGFVVPPSGMADDLRAELALLE